MRLIDADALIRKFKTASPVAIDGRARQMVEEMPTVEERKKGKWVKKRNSGLLYCSECDLPSMHNWPYCERCGADMRGES